jgi:hypothetical protein
MDFDYSFGRKKVIVATFSGQVVIYDTTNTLFPGPQLFRHQGNKELKRPDDYAITNTCLVDEKRYLFLHGQQPMIW